MRLHGGVRGWVMCVRGQENERRRGVIGDHIVIGTSFWTLSTFDTAVTYSQEEQVCGSE
jgi:hypothetical protein